MRLFVLRQQTPVQFAAVEVHSGRLQAEEADFAVEEVGCQVQRFVTIEPDQRGFVDIRVFHIEQGFDALVCAAAGGVELLELAHPLAAFTNRIAVADGQGKHGFQFADAQVGPQ